MSALRVCLDSHRAFELLADVTGGTCDLSALYGPRMASTRAAILSAVVGRKVTLREAGYNAFRSHWIGVGIIERWCSALDCRAVQERDFARNAHRAADPHCTCNDCLAYLDAHTTKGA